MQYNSQRAEDSIVGYGWTITIPYIQRLNKTGSQNLYNQGYFTSSVDGELATTTYSTSTVTYGAKVDNGSFNNYFFSNNVWTMYDKSGTRYTFGASDNAQQNASASSTQIYTWMLQEIRDQNNNYVRYVYAKDSGQIYPQKIIYTGNNSTDGIFTITFSTSPRPDPYISYKPLFKITTNYRVSQISAAVNGTVVRQYSLSYTTGNNGSRSLLSSLQETGWDASGQNAETLPAETFSYVNNSNAFAANGRGVASQSYVIGDVNGNAKPDVTVAYAYLPSTPSGTVYPDGGSAVSLPTPPGYWAMTESSCRNYSPQDMGLRFVDTNGDGKADYIQGEYNYTSNTTNTGAWINTYATSSGYAWGGSATGTIPYFESDGSGSIHYLSTGIFGDVNGDGLPDYEEAVGSWMGNGPIGDYAYLGNGTLWDAATTTAFAPMKEMPVGVPTVTNSQLVDINGDGLADWVYSDSGNTYVLLNTGTGWQSTPASQWTIATSTLYLVPGSNPAQYYDRGMRFVDINGDGLPDFIRSFQNSTSTGLSNDEIANFSVVMLNTGNGWATTTAYGSISTITQGSASTPGGQCFNEYANWTGNGQNAQDVLSTITYSQGGSANISYVKSAASGNPELPISLLVVSSIITNDGFGNTAEKDYTYSDGKLYALKGVREEKFAGFADTVERDAKTVTTTYIDQGNGASFGNGEQNDGYGQINHPYRIDISDASTGQLLRQTFNRWDSSTSSPTGNTTFVYLARQVTQDYGANGSHRDSATDYTYSTATGNVTQITRYGEVTGNSDGTFTDIGADKSTETLSYAGPSGLGTGNATSTAFSTSTTWTAPAGASSVTVDMWGAGGGGDSNGLDSGGAGAYVHAVVGVTAGNSYTATIATGGNGATQSAAGAGGTGYQSGGNGSSGSVSNGGGGGGSSAFTYDGGTLIAAGGAGGGYNNVAQPTDVSGGNGGTGSMSISSSYGTSGGGASATAGGNASGATGGAGGTGGTAMTGLPGSLSPAAIMGGTSAAGSSGNGHRGSSGVGASGSGSAAGGTGNGGIGADGTSTDSGGGGASQNIVGNNGGNGGTPAGGGGGGNGGVGGKGGSGSVVITYSTSTVSTSTTQGVRNAVYDDLVVDQSSSTVRETRHYYDSLTLGTVNLGNETKTESWLSGTSSSQYASTTQSFDGTYGLVTQSRDANGNLSTSTLDTYNIYIATTTNPILKTTGNTYDYSTGKVKTTFDVNNRLWVTAYDAVGRPLTISEPDSSTGATVTKTTYAYTDSNTPGSTYVARTDYLSSATSTQTYSYVDGLGRKLQDRKQAKGSNTYSIKDWTYNTVGLLKSESLPYFASSSARSSATSTASLFTTYTYDALQRATSIVNSIGTTSNTYDRWTVQTTDPNGNLKDYAKDAYGNLATVAEYSATSSATTTYAWDLNKSLTKTTDASGNIRNFTYDGAGRRLTAQDLHAVSDGTFGTWTYAYDSAGNVSSSTDPTNQTITYTYDALNRKLTEDYGSQAGTEVTYTYDTCTNGVGRLCVASSTSAKITNAYDPDGNASNATTTIGGISYATAYTYDRQGNLINVLYPNNGQVTYNSNAAGLVDSITFKPSSGTAANIVDSFDYAPDARIRSQADHNGTNTTYAYDSNAQYRLTRILTCGTQCFTLNGGQTQQIFSSNATWTVPVGVSSVTVDMWGGGGGGDNLGATPGGAGAYVHSVVGVTAGNNYAVYIGQGGQGATTGSAGSGGSGYRSGGGGSSGSNDNGGGGGGSSAFSYNSGTLIAAGGSGGGYNNVSQNTDVSSGNGGSGGSSINSTYGEGGGGASGTAGGSASGGSGGAGGTGGTSMTGTPGSLSPAGIIGGTSAAGSSGNGQRGIGSSGIGGAGSGGAAAGTGGGSSSDGGNGANGTGTDSAGGGGTSNAVGHSGGNGGTPAGGGGGGHVGNGGSGGSGLVIVTYGGTGPSGSTLQDLNYTYDNYGDITQIKSVASSTASTTVHYMYDTLNRLTFAYTNTGTGIAAIPHNYWGMNGTSSDSVGGLNGTDTSMSYSSTTGKILQGAAFNGSTSKIDVGVIASGTVNLSIGAWVKTTTTGDEWIIDQNNVGTVNGNWRLLLSGGKVTFFVIGPGGAGMPSYFSGSTNVADGAWHYVGVSQTGNAYSLYVDGVLDAQTTIGTAVSYDGTVPAGIGYDRRDAMYYFLGNIDEMSVWTTSLSANDFATLYNAGIGYAYPWGTSTLATSSYAAQPYTYDALGNFTTKGANKYTYAQTGDANPDAVTQIANGLSTTTYSYDNDGNLTAAGTSTFSWDYNNRMTQAVTQGSTSTYSYDYAGNRVSQVNGNTTTIYPNKYYSITSSVSGATTTATTTVYVWNGDTLIATIDQVTVNGVNSGSPSTRYIHPDHLGSTNIVSDESGTIVQDAEYYPYGETRLNQTTYPTNEARRFIGQFTDANSLQYLNARYLNSQQGQFLSEDPSFLAVGDQAQVQQVTRRDQQALLSDPQLLNSYGYARDNPITQKDPDGKIIPLILAAVGFGPEAIAVLSTALDVYGASMLGIDTYSGVNVLRYPSGYSPEEKRAVGGQLTWDLVTFGAGKLGNATQQKNLDVLTASLDAINAASGGSTLDSPPKKRQPAQGTSLPVFNVSGSAGGGNQSWATQQQGTQSRSSGSQGASQRSGNSSAGYGAFVGLFNPFLPLMPVRQKP